MVLICKICGMTAKKEENGDESLYADKTYQVKVNMSRDCITKHIFVGDTRIASRVTFNDLTHSDNEEIRGVYYYHPDHLGNTTFVSDYRGEEYQHLEYTPYGETWVEENTDTNKYITYKFTGKELDEETGLYYFGARYYDSKTSVFMSADPIYDGVKEGFGVYTYCRNNPMIYHDPNGLETKDTKNNAPPHPGAHPDATKNTSNYAKKVDKLFKAYNKYVSENYNKSLKDKSIDPVQGDFNITATDKYKNTNIPHYKGSDDLAVDYRANTDTAVVTTTDQYLNIAKWNSNDDTVSVKNNPINSGTITTQGVGFGLYVKTEDSTRQFTYAHLNPSTETDGLMNLLGQANSLNIRIFLPKGTTIGRVGSTGNSTGPHLHLGIKRR